MLICIIVNVFYLKLCNNKSVDDCYIKNINNFIDVMLSKRQILKGKCYVNLLYEV